MQLSVSSSLEQAVGVHPNLDNMHSSRRDMQRVGVLVSGAPKPSIVLVCRYTWVNVFDRGAKGVLNCCEEFSFRHG